jgi:hypothetical protein
VAVYRVMYTGKWTDSLPRDAVVNVLHFAAPSALSGAELNDLCADVADAYETTTPFGSRGHHVKAYDIEDDMPRPIKGEAIVAASGAVATSGNRDVALCLSFYSGRNLPRQRGRIYLGPFSSTDAGSNKPPAALITALAGMPAKFAAAGPATAEWGIYSRTEDTCRGVTNWYIDNEWDTQRRRGFRSDSRTVGTVTA